MSNVNANRAPRHGERVVVDSSHPTYGGRRGLVNGSLPYGIGMDLRTVILDGSNGEPAEKSQTANTVSLPERYLVVEKQGINAGLSLRPGGWVPKDEQAR